MVRPIVVGFFLIFMAGPVWAADAEPFNPDAPFQQGFSTSVLRSLLNGALDVLEDHVDITGNLDPDNGKGDRRGNLRFKFYPEGKSKSDQHHSAEGWFRLSPDHTLRDFYFRFKNPEEPANNSSRQSGEVL